MRRCLDVTFGGWRGGVSNRLRPALHGSRLHRTAGGGSAARCGLLLSSTAGCGLLLRHPIGSRGAARDRAFLSCTGR